MLLMAGTHASNGYESAQFRRPNSAAAPQPPRSSFSCDRHPTENFTGFCHLPLRAPHHSRRQLLLQHPLICLRRHESPLLLLLLRCETRRHQQQQLLPTSEALEDFIFPELRRTKSFSTSNNEALSQFFEPQRKSYDVRGRKLFWSLFSLDDGGASSGQNPANGKKIGSLAAERPVFKETENDDDFRDPENVEIDEIEESHLENSRNEVEFEVNEGKIVEEESNVKNIKKHIDLHNQEKKSSTEAGFGWRPLFSARNGTSGGESRR
ncbi:hypothetical protein SASPL_156837 [Salvia splendens]|uniref:Uncharacterized protein n=1 Tax=Salvia splendens TaxID=180675 RepID=A0A8X8VVZ7_SALSN|nr:hypothetical protein SASPL_156837 [Salvia splendens]